MVLEAQFLGEVGAKEDPPCVGAARCSQTEQGGSGRVPWGSLQQEGPFHPTTRPRSRGHWFISGKQGGFHEALTWSVTQGGQTRGGRRAGGWGGREAGLTPSRWGGRGSLCPDSSLPCGLSLAEALGSLESWPLHSASPCVWLRGRPSHCPFLMFGH